MPHTATTTNIATCPCIICVHVWCTVKEKVVTSVLHSVWWCGSGGGGCGSRLHFHCTSIGHGTGGMPCNLSDHHRGNIGSDECTGKESQEGLPLALHPDLGADKVASTLVQADAAICLLCAVVARKLYINPQLVSECVVEVMTTFKYLLNSHAIGAGVGEASVRVFDKNHCVKEKMVWWERSRKDHHWMQTHSQYVCTYLCTHI